MLLALKARLARRARLGHKDRKAILVRRDHKDRKDRLEIRDLPAHRVQLVRLRFRLMPAILLSSAAIT